MWEFAAEAVWSRAIWPTRRYYGLFGCGSALLSHIYISGVLNEVPRPGQGRLRMSNTLLGSEAMMSKVLGMRRDFSSTTPPKHCMILSPYRPPKQSSKYAPAKDEVVLVYQVCYLVLGTAGTDSGRGSERERLGLGQAPVK